jgi:eukaryotic-like serine/threonine-protein kinase
MQALESVTRCDGRSRFREVPALILGEGTELAVQLRFPGELRSLLVREQCRIRGLRRPCRRDWCCPSHSSSIASSRCVWVQGAPVETAAETSSTTSGRSRLEPGMLTQLLRQLAAPAPAPPASGPVAGDVIGRFRLEKEIGRGGFGRVFRATDLELGREVALKLVRPERSGTVAMGDWMRVEAESAAQLRHPNVVTLFDAGHWEGFAYLVYELLRGQTLARRVLARRIPRREARRILTDVASALAHVHAAGVVHRDVKPANIFLETDGSVKLLDLGLSQVAGAIGVAAGSPPWMAPEQGRGVPADARADVYAWGLLAVLLVDGVQPDDPPTRHRLRLPGSLRALAEKAQSPDPALRLRDGGALLEALARMERRRRRARLGGALAATLAAVLAAAVALRPPPPPLPPLRLAIADPEVTGGDARIQGLSDLIARGLDAVSGLSVVDRTRIAGVLRASGRPMDRHDAEATAFAARQVGAAAVLVPVVRVENGDLLISLEARDPETGAVVASAVERASPGDPPLLAAVSRLVDRVANGLMPRRRGPRATDAAIDRAVTASLEAHRRYAAGIRCKAEPSRGESWIRTDCTEHFRAALAFDPDFPLAHFELAREAVFAGTPSIELVAALRPALERLERVPPRERAQLVAWKADLEGRPAEALAILRRARAEYPDDAWLAFALGQTLEREGRLAEAVEPLASAVALDPGLETATDLLVWTLGRLDRAAELRQLADRMAALPPYPGTLHAEVLARGWAGDVEGALRVARRAAGAGRAARADLVDALVAAGRLEEAEALQRERGDGAAAERKLAAVRFLSGQRRKALTVLDAPLPPDATPLDRFVAGSRRAWRLAELRDGAGIARIAEGVRPYSLELAASLAPVLAYSGEVDLALELAPHMAGQPGTRRLLDALVTWRREGAARALPELRALAGGEGLLVAEVLPPEAPAWLAAECAAEAERGEQVLSDVRRFQRAYRPLGPWRLWAYPRSLVLEARLLERMGRRAEAREALARFEALWARADPELPLVGEARALRRRLAASGDGAAPSSDRRRTEREGGMK